MARPAATLSLEFKSTGWIARARPGWAAVDGAKSFNRLRASRQKAMTNQESQDKEQSKNNQQQRCPIVDTAANEERIGKIRLP
jgi:hypothetical protein